MNLTFESTLTTIVCSTCGIQFAIPRHLCTKLRDNHQSFYCPNGHSQYFPAETEAEKYKRLYHREQEQARINQVDANQAWRKLSNAERKLDRIEKGVCPKCNRSFQNVKRHMESKHKTKKCK